MPATQHSNASGVWEDNLMHCRLVHRNPTLQLLRWPNERDEDSPCIEQEVVALRQSHSGSNPPAETQMPECICELVDKIATLETQVIQLERHLLSMYRSTFDEFLPDSDADASCRSYGHLQARLMSQENSSPCPIKSPKNEASGSACLTDHHRDSLVDHEPDMACRLSGYIVRCIAAIYCKLASPPTEQLDLRPPSVTTSGTLSTEDPSDDSWSSPRRKDIAASEDGMIDIRRISANRYGFVYASRMLTILRSLVQGLETIDPRKMNKQEQLAFWINIHNALVMHAFLAFGTQEKNSKSALSVLKAAYNVGGLPINVRIIQGSILRCQPQRQPHWLCALLSPAIKSMKSNETHPYALSNIEPLCHFALSTGAYSDPAVRVYTSNGVFEELKLAMEEFIRSNTAIHNNSKKILLPRLLYQYAKDASIELPNLIKIVGACMVVKQQWKKNAEERLQTRENIGESIEWSQYKTSFRYLIGGDLPYDQTWPLLFSY